MRAQIDKRLRLFTAGCFIAAVLMLIVTAILAVVNPSKAADVSSPTVVNAAPRTIALNTWNDFATFTSPGAVWAESAATVSIHNGLANDSIQIRASVDGVLTWTGDFRMHNTNWTVPGAVRQYALEPGDVMTYQVRAGRSGTGNVTLAVAHAWWTTQPRTTPTTPPPTTPTTAPPTTTPPPPTTPPPGAFPDESTTGHTGTLTTAPNCTVEAGTTETGMQYNCPTLTVQAGAKVDNGLINGQVRGSGTGTRWVIEDSTIQQATCVGSEPAVAYNNYTLTRVHIKGHNDGARVEGPNVTVEDSLIENCFAEGGHADGIQVCPNPPCGGSSNVSGVVFDHNTVTHPKRDSTGAIFIMDGAGGQYTNNLLMGYSITVRIHSPGHTFTGNRIVWDSGRWGEFDVDFGNPCQHTWSDNRYVTMVGPPPAPGDQDSELPYGPGYDIATTGDVVPCNVSS
jgi:hypothetical protein